MDTLTHRTYSSAEACDLADISYRQLDYWARIGVCTPDQEARGSGSRRRWTAQQIAVLAVLARVGAHIKVSHLAELVSVLTDWNVATWDSSVTLLVDDRGGVWLDQEAGAPAVATAVNLGAIAAELAQRGTALGT